MRKFYSLLFFALSVTTQAQIVNIPDANFKAKLLSASNSNSQVASSSTPVFVNNNWSVPDYCKIDTNNDGEIQVSEALTIKWLKIQTVYDVADLTGLEAFTNLEYFLCTDNSTLNTIDISQNTLLKVLRIGNNNFNTLNVSNNVNLLQLECYNSNLTSLNISNNSLLKRLLCYNNTISSLDFSTNPNLEYIQCGVNNLTNIDVSSCPLLTTLTCYGNPLTNINVKNNNNSWLVMNFATIPNLQYICSDEEDILMIQEAIDDYGYTNCHVNSYCSFVPGGAFYTIQGTTKFDFDTNGCASDDINYPMLNCSITNGTVTGSLIGDSSGNYSIPVQAGNYTITPTLENPTYFNISPSTIVANFPTQVSPLTQDFCMTANGVHHDVELTILPTSPARPGFDANYTIVYKNKGNQMESGAVTLAFDYAVLDLVSANPTFSSQTPNLLTWNYTNLLPLETRTIHLVFNVNSPTETPSVAIDDILNYTASITPVTTDEFAFDNTSILNQTVVGSYDPNDKRCLEGTTVGPEMIGQYVHYVIRFENTGTYPAENIVVKDMIDVAKFDVNTLIPLHASHDFVTRIKDNKVEFIFEGIHLPFDDATNDGYVAFKIKMKSNLVLGSTFSNVANIYFDYNFPIITNNYTTTIQNSLSLPISNSNNTIVAYPNPVKDVLHFESDHQLLKIEIYDVAGRIVSSNSINENKIDLSALPNGSYILKLFTEEGTVNTKIIKE